MPPQEAVASAIGRACAGVDDGSAEQVSRHLSIVLSARLFVEIQKMSAMEEGPDKTAAWHRLVMAYVELRRADFYGVKVRHDREKSRISRRRSGKQRRRASRCRPKEKEERINQILGRGRFEAHWNNFEKEVGGTGSGAAV